MMDFKQFAEHLAAAAARVREALVADLEVIGEEQKKIAQSYMGPGYPSWPPLAESTLADKIAHGFPVPSPLLRTGDMRDSLQVEAEPTAMGAEMTLGSESKIALYQEMGTATIPPRPFLATSAVAVLPVAEKQLGETAVSLLVPGLKR